MWETLFRVGGASGTDLQTVDCVWTRKYRPSDKYFCSVKTRISLLTSCQMYGGFSHAPRSSQRLDIYGKSVAVGCR
jgi:hypothetical protein